MVNEREHDPFSPHTIEGDEEVDPEVEDTDEESEVYEDEDTDEVKRPTKSANKDEWISYADSIGAVYDEDATKDQIIEAVEATEGE